MVSELVTNAIRYGREPIELRIILYMADNRGARYSRDGKVIWAEQILPNSSPP